MHSIKHWHTLLLRIDKVFVLYCMRIHLVLKISDPFCPNTGKNNLRKSHDSSPCIYHLVASIFIMLVTMKLCFRLVIVVVQLFLTHVLINLRNPPSQILMV